MLFFNGCGKVETEVQEELVRIIHDDYGGGGDARCSSSAPFSRQALASICMHGLESTVPPHRTGCRLIHYLPTSDPVLHHDSPQQHWNPSQAPNHEVDIFTTAMTAKQE